MSAGKGPAAEDRSDLHRHSRGKALPHRGGFALNRNSCLVSKPHRPAGLALHPWPGTLPWKKEALPRPPSIPLELD